MKVGYGPQKVGVPGARASTIVMPPTISVFIETRVPASVAGAVAHGMPIEMKPEGRPPRANSIAASIGPSS